MVKERTQQEEIVTKLRFDEWCWSRISKVDKIIGPGNIFVAEAKKQLSGKLIGTESMYAGASEICVLADKNTNINQVVTSLISQAEHDSDSQCILVTKDKKITLAENLYEKAIRGNSVDAMYDYPIWRLPSFKASFNSKYRTKLCNYLASAMNEDPTHPKYSEGQQLNIKKCKKS